MGPDRGGPDRGGPDRAGPGPGGGGAGWVRARGPAPQVPLSPPGPCPPARGDWRPKWERDGESASASPRRGLGSAGRRHLVCEGAGQVGGGTTAYVQSVKGNGRNVEKPLVFLNSAPTTRFPMRGMENYVKAPPLYSSDWSVLMSV